jgi:hypothetical protein
MRGAYKFAHPLDISRQSQGGFMGVITGDDQMLLSWIRKEIELTQPLKLGSRGQEVTRVQEWLNLQGFGLAIDGDFVTKQRVQQFQEDQGLAVTGIVNPSTFEALVSPLKQVLESINARSQTFPSLVMKYAQAHLKQNPREIGGQNCGPWVRLYMKGHEGADWPWCAGFVSFVMKQAAETLQISGPIEGSFSCDSLAAQAQTAGVLIRESDLVRGNKSFNDLSETSIFLVKRTETDWSHTGFATGFSEVSFDTIEGNTNDEGSREGFEVCARARGYSDKDFILL